MFVEYINHRHLVFISLRSSENGTERNGTGNLLLTWFSCPYPVEENAFPLVYRKFALDYRLCTFKQVWTWYSWFMFLFIPALGSSSSSCFFSLVYIKVVSISDSRTRLRWMRPLKKPPRWGVAEEPENIGSGSGGLSRASLSLPVAVTVKNASLFNRSKRLNFPTFS